MGKRHSTWPPNWGESAVAQLLQLGADPAAKNAQGKTALEMVQAQLERENAIYAELLKVEAVLKDPPAKK